MNQLFCKAYNEAIEDNIGLDQIFESNLIRTIDKSVNICYKSNKECKYNCNGLCKDNY